MFPRLFSLSNQKDAKVGEMVLVQEGGRVWNLTWRRNPFIWEGNLIANLMALLEDVRFRGEEDRWEWLPDDGGAFHEGIFFLLFGRARLRPKWWHSFGLYSLIVFLQGQILIFDIF